MPQNFIRGKGDEPFAQETQLGWSILGNIDTEIYNDDDVDDDDISDVIGLSHRIITTRIPENLKITDQRKEVKFICHTSTKEQLMSIGKLLESEFSEKKCDEITMSQDDLRFKQVLENGIHKDDCNYYKMP